MTTDGTSVSDPTEPPSGYLNWKGWEARRFGTLARGDADYFARELRGLVSDGPPRVLEVGFGNGIFLSYCRSKGWNVTGTELLPELVETARAAGYDAVPADQLDTLPALQVPEELDPHHGKPPAETAEAE